MVIQKIVQTLSLTFMYIYNTSQESVEDRKENVENQQEQLELDFDIDVEEDKEELQMPELSKGKYIHDFKVRLL